jgi:hypothetical protein
MDDRKQTPHDREGRKRKPRDPGPDREASPAPQDPVPEEPTWRPADDLFGDDAQPVDRDLGLGGKGKFSRPPPTPKRHG